MPDVLVCGDWHLASVTAAGLVQLGYVVHIRPGDPGAADDVAFEEIAAGRRAANEPRVADILAAARAEGALRAVLDDAQTANVLRAARLSLVAYDTVTAADGTVTDSRPAVTTEKLLRHRERSGPVVLLSQVRAGTSDAAVTAAGLQAGSPDLVHLPENLRLGHAVPDFLHPARVIVGCNAPEVPAAVRTLLSQLSAGTVLTMSLVEAELVKHATNAYLAACITLANDVGTIAGHLGADPATVLDGVRADERVADRAPLRPGEAYAGATLHRDVRALCERGELIGRDGLFRAIARANTVHALAPLAVLDRRLDGLAGRRICLLGLTYKPGVSTLRDSPGLRLARELRAQGADVTAYDPVAEAADLPGMRRCDSLAAAACDADCVALVVEHEAFTDPTGFDGLAPRGRVLLRLTGSERRSRVATPPGWESVSTWSG